MSETIVYVERFIKHLVLYTSNAILSRVIPGAEGYISLGIAVLNAIMTFPAVYLIEVRVEISMVQPLLMSRRYCRNWAGDIYS